MSGELEIGVLGGEVLDGEVYCLRNLLEKRMEDVLRGETAEGHLVDMKQ